MDQYRYEPDNSFNTLKQDTIVDKILRFTLVIVLVCLLGYLAYRQGFVRFMEENLAGTLSFSATTSNTERIKTDLGSWANDEFHKAFGQNINSVQQGEWYIEKNGTTTYADYVSPITEKEGKRVYVAFSFVKSEGAEWELLTRKFFNEGEDFRNNHR